VPTGNFRSGNDQSGGRGKRGRMQRLADVTNGILSRGVLVQKATACGEIEKRQAYRNGDTAAERSRSQRQRKGRHIFG
jgi:hypothetical protein